MAPISINGRLLGWVSSFLDLWTRKHFRDMNGQDISSYQPWSLNCFLHPFPMSVATGQRHGKTQVIKPGKFSAPVACLGHEKSVVKLVDRPSWVFDIRWSPQILQMWWSLLSKVTACLHKMNSRRLFFVASFLYDEFWIHCNWRYSNMFHFGTFHGHPRSTRALVAESSEIKRPFHCCEFQMVIPRCLTFYLNLTSRDTSILFSFSSLSLSFSPCHSFAFMSICFWVKKHFVEELFHDPGST